MAANTGIRKIECDVERIDGWKFSIEVVLVTLKQYMATFFRNKYTATERIILTMVFAKSLV